MVEPRSGLWRDFGTFISKLRPSRTPQVSNVFVENASTGIYILTIILDNGTVKNERIIIS